MTARMSPTEARARLRAGEKLREVFFDQSGRPQAKLAGLQGEVVARGLLNDRSVEFVISTGSLDRYNSTIAPGGWRLESFLANPIVLWSHDNSIPAIARADGVRVEGSALRSRATFAERDVHPLADTIFQLVKGKFINAASVGWIPLEYEFGEDGQINYLEQELLEWSVVNIPANPECLTQARSFGIDTRPIAEWAERSLDLGTTRTPKNRLVALRNAAGPTKLYPAKGTKPMTKQSATRADSVMRKWDTFGEFLLMVARACGDRGTTDRRLVGASTDRRLVRAPTGAGEIDPSLGGFLVDTQFAEELVGIAYAEESVLAPLCDRRETSAPLADVKVPAIDETSRADGSRWGGTASYWVGEGASATLSMPRFRNLAFANKKLLAAVVVTNELLDDVPMLEAHMRRAFTAELGFRLDESILAGDGAGKPLGILNSPALITVAKETGQATQTIVAQNVAKMWARLPAPSRRRAVWLVNEDAEQQLEAMTFATDGAPSPAAAALYMPAGANGNEFATLKGRPIATLEQCSVLGTVGDIVLADMLHYVLIDGGIKPALSLDVKFTTDEAVFRFTLRVDGQSAFASPITPYNGATNTRSPFVALAAR